MIENDSVMEVKDGAERVVRVYRKISETTCESIPDILKAYSKNPLVADFVDAVFEAVTERAAKIEKDDNSNLDIVYYVSLTNVLEMFVINIDRLLANKCTAANLNLTVYFLWVVWSG